MKVDMKCPECKALNKPSVTFAKATFSHYHYTCACGFRWGAYKELEDTAGG